MPNEKRVLAAAIVVALLGMIGCNHGPASVSGKVTYRGKPLTTGTVYMTGTDGVQAAAAINPDGSYQIFAVAPGPARIAVISLKPPSVRQRPAKRAAVVASLPPPASKSAWFAIPGNYADPLSSGLATELKGGANEHDINLQ